MSLNILEGPGKFHIFRKMSLNVLEFSSHCHHKKLLSYFLVKEVRKEEGAIEIPICTMILKSNDMIQPPLICMYPNLRYSRSVWSINPRACSSIMSLNLPVPILENWTKNNFGPWISWNFDAVGPWNLPKMSLKVLECPWISNSKLCGHYVGVIDRTHNRHCQSHRPHSQPPVVGVIGHETRKMRPQNEWKYIARQPGPRPNLSTNGGQEFVHTPPKPGPQKMPTDWAQTDQMTE